MHSSEYQKLMGIIDNCGNDLIFYHYCSSDTFLSICTGKKLRFSDMHSMNDFLEGTWGYEIFIRVVNNLLEQNIVSLEFVDSVDKNLHDASLHHLKLICCLSKDGDVLSQWRAYTSDATGYCLGFSANELLKMPIRVLDVIYNEAEQIENLQTILKTLNKIYVLEDKEAFINLCYQLSVNLIRFKNPAFKEELEVRLVHIAQLDLSDENNPKYVFDNGFSNGEAVNYQIKYRMNGSIPTAFIDFDFFNSKINPIKQVILGPKNIAHPAGVLMAMSSMGLNDVEVKKSEASYR